MKGVESKYAGEARLADAQVDAAAEQRKAAYRIAEMEKTGEIRRKQDESQGEYELRAARQEAELNRKNAAPGLVIGNGQSPEAVDRWSETGKTSGMVPSQTRAARKPIDDFGSAMKFGANDADLMTETGGKGTSNGELFVSALEGYRTENPDYDPNDSRLIRAAMKDAGIANVKLDAADARYMTTTAGGMSPSQLIEAAMDANPLVSFDEVVKGLITEGLLLDNPMAEETSGAPARSGAPKKKGKTVTRPNVGPRI
jgi:hypothetical protein